MFNEILTIMKIGQKEEYHQSEAKEDRDNYLDLDMNTKVQEEKKEISERIMGLLMMKEIIFRIR